MGTEILKNRSRTIQVCMKSARQLHDERARWIARRKPEIARDLLSMALDELPEEMPTFCGTDELETFVEEIQFDVIQRLRRAEQAYCMGVVFEAASRSRWQWILERAVGEIVRVAAELYLGDLIEKRR
jgi:hypothetical protein